MTCIVGYEHENKVYLGCDSATVDGWTIQLTAQSKIFKLGEFLIGCAGFPRVSQLIQYSLSLKPQQENQTSFAYLCTEFSSAVKTILNDNDSIHSSENGKGLPETSVLFGYRKHLYILDTNFQIIQFKDKYAAIGSGMDLALGAMAALSSVDLIKSMKPENKIKIALEASAKHNTGVQKPFKIMSI